jgi:hypothetical protein
MWEGILMEEETFEYVHPELKYIPMTDEYAAQYWHQQGWMACRLAYKRYEESEKAGAFKV